MLLIYVIMLKYYIISVLLLQLLLLYSVFLSQHKRSSLAQAETLVLCWLLVLHVPHNMGIVMRDFCILFLL